MKSSFLTNFSIASPTPPPFFFAKNGGRGGVEQYPGIGDFNHSVHSRLLLHVTFFTTLKFEPQPLHFRDFENGDPVYFHDV